MERRGAPGDGGRAATLGELYVSFLRVGAVMFGGGYAMLPLLEREVVVRRGWCSADEMSDVYALAQLVPGVIAVNTAMLVGQRHRGWLGSLVAALGTVTVPFVVMLLIAVAFEHLAGSRTLTLFLTGLRPAVAGLLLGAALRFVRRGWQRRWQWCVGLAVAAAALLLDLNPAGLILSGIAAGLLWQGWHAALARVRKGRP
jgi:chromate transporter